MNGYALYYKDKDTYVVPLSEFGNTTIFPTQHAADAAMQETLDKINNMLYPVIKYKKKNWWSKKMVRVDDPKPLQPFTKVNLTIIKNSLHVKRVKLVAV